MEMPVDVDMEIDDAYIDDFYESIDAPMYVDFTLPLPEPDDGPAWFCRRVGCTKDHDQKIFELPVVVGKSSKFAPPSKLSNPKFASNFMGTKTIPSKASAAHVVPTSISLKGKGKDMLNLKVCGSKAKVGGLSKEKKGEMKAPVFQGAGINVAVTNVNSGMTKAKVTQPDKSRNAAQKASSVSTLESKAIKTAIVCEDRDNKKEDAGKKMIVMKEKENIPAKKTFGLTRVVEAKLGVDGPRASKLPLSKVRMNANELNVKGENSKVGVDAPKSRMMSLVKVGMNANTLNIKEEKSLKVGLNDNKFHVKTKKSKLGVDLQNDSKIPLLKEGMNATKKVVVAKKVLNGNEAEKKSEQKGYLRRDVSKLSGKLLTGRQRADASKVATSARLRLSKEEEGAAKKRATSDCRQFTKKIIEVKKDLALKEKDEKPVRKVDDIRINGLKQSGIVLVERKTTRDPMRTKSSTEEPTIDGRKDVRVDILPLLAETSGEKKKADAVGGFFERMEEKSYMENTTAFDCNRSQTTCNSFLLDGADQGIVDSPANQPTHVPMRAVELPMDIDMEIDDVYIDDFYESIDAPMYVDFTLPLPEPDDSTAWFCHRIGCTKNHDQMIFELPVVVGKSSKFAPPSKLSNPKLASNFMGTKTIPSKASAAHVVPTSISLKGKGKEMLNLKVCGSKAKVGGLFMEKKGEMMAPFFQGAGINVAVTNFNSGMKKAKVTQPSKADKSGNAVQKASSLSTLKSKAMRTAIVCQDRSNKKEDVGKNMIFKKEKEKIPAKKAFDLRSLNAKGEKTKVGDDGPKSRMMSLLKVGTNANTPDSSPPNVDSAVRSHTCSSTRTGSTTTAASCSATTFGSSTTRASCSTTTSSCSAATSLPINATTSSVNNLGASAIFRTQTMRVFGIDEIMAATNNFSCANFLGGGSFGKVYRGQFVDGEVVAVKKLINTPERVCDFFLEYGIMAHLHHPNILTLLGSCHEEGLHLVLQFASRGSLASLIRDQGCSFDWEHRYKVALGVAKGLLYLHRGSRRRVIHMDIKLENIVVGEDYEPKISDFGTAVWLPHGESHIVDAKFRGTDGYMPPEYKNKRIICEKNDVYAFGVLLLELISGRRTSAAIALFQNGKVRELIDPRLGNSYSMEQVTKILKVASMCTKYMDSERRPEMDKVVHLLAQ